MTTPDRRILPAAQAVLVDRAGRATPPFYDLLRRIVDTTALTPELVDEVKQILEQIENLPTEGFMPITSRVVGQDSIEWQGLLANGLTTLRLYGDTSDQRSTWYYGTNSSNEKGWYRFYDALATGAGILKRNSGYVELGEVDDPADLPDSGNAGEAYWVRGAGDIEERGLWVWDADAGEWALDTEASGIVGFEIAEDDYGDITVSDVGATWTINENAITDEKLRDSAALSVIGRVSDASGDPADIVASADKAVLHRNGDALSFAPIDHTYVSDFAEAAQDAVGGILSDSAEITLTYDDETPTIFAELSAAVRGLLTLADTAVQPDDLAEVAFSGDYGDLANRPAIPPDVSAASFLTEGDETGTLENSRQLVAGENVAFDDSTPGQLVINASGGGGSPADPTALVGLEPVKGSASTFMRSDAAPALDQGISPTWTGTHTFEQPITVAGVSSDQWPTISYIPFDVVVRGSVTPGTYEIVEQQCSAVRIGNLVIAQINLFLANSLTGGGAGYLQIAGLPIAKAAGSFPAGTAVLHDIDFTGNYVQMLFVTAGTTDTLFLAAVGANAAAVEVPISSAVPGAWITGTIIYEAQL